MKKLNKVISFFKSNYTKEEVLQLDKKELNQIAKQKGFAIGTILLAIALIAAIGAAIAIASKSGGQDSSNQTARLAASNVINMGSTIKSTVDKFRVEVVDIGNIVFNPNANGISQYHGIFNPTIGTNYTALPKTALISTPAIPTASTCGTIFNTANICNKGTADVTVSGGYGGWYISSDFASEAGTGSTDTAIILAGVTPEVCLDINKQIHGTKGMTTTATNPIPTMTTAVSSFNGSEPITPPANADLATTTAIGGDNNYRSWNEGCFRNGTSGDYFYFNIIKTN